MSMKSYKYNREIGCWLVLLIVVIFLSITMYIFRNPFHTHYILEAGDSLEIEKLLKEKTENPKFVDKIDKKLLSTVGIYTIRVENKYSQYNVNLLVKDTILPKAKVKKLDMWIGDEITSDLFISNIKDISPVKTSFLKAPDLTKEGKQDIIILLKDISGNTTPYKTTLNLKKDTEAPVISTVNTILSNKGETILYKKNTSVTDNRDKDIELKVDSSQVNYNKPGTYYAIYSAQDRAGNKASKKVKVIILNKNDTSLKNEAKELAKDFIKMIASDKKTKQEKLKACYDYIRNNMVYNGIHKGTIDNYYIDAVDGLKTWKGDCLVSNGVLRVVCEELGVPTIVVERSSQKKTNHYWFLADTGDGWYHYDAFKRKNVIIYRWTDDQLLQWSKSNQRLADFDKSKYPSTPKK
ncbi:MAG: hypothetical protein HFF36_04745 [Coprobacillus sp.]|nr:hypothetical protein [Coprobacillus sp.]MCI9093082.1 hypothetical protein [Coprobacillus sp.]